MTIRHLEIFVAVADYGSMQSAAKALFISQPSVSGAIASLEDEWQTKLFDRLGKGLHLSVQGQSLLVLARQMLDITRQIHLQTGSTLFKDTLRIGATLTVGSTILPNLILGLCPTPRVVIQNTHEIEFLLLQSKLDVAIVEGRTISSDLICTPIITDKLCLICDKSHPFASEIHIKAHMLNNAPLLLREAGSGTRELFEQAMREVGICVLPQWESQSTTAILNGINAGFGVSVLSSRLVDKDKFCVREIEDLPLQRTFNLVYHKNKFLSKPLSQFIDQCTAKKIAQPNKG